MKQLLKQIVTYILTYEARLVLAKYKPYIIAITGSVGKTSTKDAVYTVLSRYFFVRRSKKSFNSEIGVPLTILHSDTAWTNIFGWFRVFVKGAGLIILKNHYPKILILETGVDRPGDMKRLLRLVSPDMVLVTKFSEIPPHVEFFPSKKALFDEKWMLAQHVKKEGSLVINGDDQALSQYISNVGGEKRIYTYGFSSTNDIVASHDHVVYTELNGMTVPDGISVKVDYKGNSVPLKISGTIGRGMIYAALAAFAAGIEKDINLVDIIEALRKFTAPPGRLTLLEGIKSSIIIDDTYNASPEAMKLALSLLHDIEPRAKKIAVLGDMLELGKYTLEAHHEVGVMMPPSITHLYLVGKRAAHIAESIPKGTINEKNVLFFDDAVSCGKHLQNIIREGDIILVKGSQGVRLERVVEEIMAHPEKKKELLVRQDEEWTKR